MGFCGMVWMEKFVSSQLIISRKVPPRLPFPPRLLHLPLPPPLGWQFEVLAMEWARIAVVVLLVQQLSVEQPEHYIITCDFKHFKI
jgi:hypothetical protein